MLFFRITKVQKARKLHDKYKRTATNSIRAFLVISDVVLKCCNKRISTPIQQCHSPQGQ
jgi:hypothetical protein